MYIIIVFSCTITNRIHSHILEEICSDSAGMNIVTPIFVWLKGVAYI